eukprot:gene29509-38613_t
MEIHVDLYSMLHVADVQYYKEIEDRMREYDLILLELITSVNNSRLLLSNSNDLLDKSYKRVLVGEIISPQAESLAKQLGLATQLSNLYLPNRLRRGWYIADLDAETIYELENKNRDKTASKYYLSRLFGRSFSEQLLKNFYLSDKVFISILRLASWLTPCPELSCLLFDWSRMSPKAGGVSSVIVPILEMLLSGQFVDAKKLAFAQELLSGIPDAGSWGGEALSDTAVRIIARNKECCRNSDDSTATLDGSLQHGEGRLTVAVLYGAYHVNDLAERFVNDLGLVPSTTTTATAETISSSKPDVPDNLTCWRIQAPSLGRALSPTSGDDSGSGSGSGSDITTRNTKTLAVLAGGVGLYLFAGAMDWLLLCDVLAKALQVYVEGSLSLLPEAPPTLPPLDTTVLVAGFYLIFYIQRHLYMLRQIGLVGIQWDRGLFLDM